MRGKKKVAITTVAIVVVLGLVGIFIYNNLNKSTDTVYSYDVNEVIAFGDSFTDNGGAYEATKKALENDNLPSDAAILPAELDSDLYWQGRWSNGMTAAEILAQNLDVDITDYAVGGAFSGKYNYYDWLNEYEATGVLSQIDKYEESTDGNANSEALYFLMSSANDFFYHYDYAVEGDAKPLADDAVDNQIEAVKELADMGARNFLIAGSTKLQDEPWCVDNGYAKNAKIFTDEYNSELEEGLEELEQELNEEGVDVQIEFFDYAAAQTDIQDNASDYGLTELEIPYQYTYPEFKVNDADESECYFWDEWHPTKVVHQAMGDKMTEQIAQ